MTVPPTTNTTSQNVATNTPAIIARKRALEGAAIIVGAGALVDGLQAAMTAMTCQPGTPCTYDWAFIVNVAFIAIIGGIAKGVSAYVAANANVSANAAQSDTKGSP